MILKKSSFRIDCRLEFVCLFRWTARWSRLIRLQPLTKSGYPIFQGFSLTSKNTFTALQPSMFWGVEMRKNQKLLRKTEGPRKNLIWHLSQYYRVLSLIIKHLPNRWHLEKFFHLVDSPIRWIGKSCRNREFENSWPISLHCRAFCNYMKGWFLILKTQSTRIGINNPLLYILMSFQLIMSC